ncbi:putative metal-dependent enzyme [Rubrobacter radiotolerans]|uniref:DUF1385 domain-containing protein n=1 Tax=Rubrobacter radiotolerans TaxID=42256 RepID=A0A023X3F1_RUBRA|nr:DUF1385 domain-containing protein [Rubrobacter radiotolerans]AHY46878.1 putative metal-dependent enzyme [Rubrobacter radiotolerans]MDX5894283.1 DUF1385 domain-containing protein [Rubrobacter radiotolerans]SMC05644.1 Uncharacterized conserved protein YqhQ [Rubrobacter radiotolerans DSM 5868]
MKVGGQAIMEGVLMRSPNFWAMAVKTPEGELDVRAEPFRSVTKRSALLRLPIVRGFVSLAETLVLGMKALTISTNVALGEDEDFSKKEIAVTFLFAMVLAVGLFLAAPVLAVKGVGLLLGGQVENALLFSLIEGAVRIAIFIGYIVAISAFSRDIKRFFAYHGAEHKAIKVYEAGEELVPENARRLDTMHVRCGTSFILYVLVLSILVFSLLGVEGWVYMVVSRIVVIPLVAGIGFEFIMWSARNQGSALVRALTWPGLQLQRLTTREPDDGMVEVAMASLKKVLSLEEEAKIKNDASAKLVI